MIKLLENNMKSGVLLLFFGLFCYGFYKFYASLYPTADLHYRLDVTFEVDGITVTGSAVQKLSVIRVRGLTPRAFNLTATGEAVAVDLPNSKTVFVLLASPTKDGIFTGSTRGRYDFLLPDACGLWKKRDELGPSGFVRFFENLSGSCSIEPEYLPLMVTFQDKADPNSVTRVDPDKPEKALGTGARFIDATITITDEPITTEIGDQLKWLSEYYEPRLEVGDLGGSQNPTFPQIMQHGFFRRLDRD